VTVQPSLSGDSRTDGVIRAFRALPVRAIRGPYRRALRAAARLEARIRARALIRYLRRLKPADAQRTFCGILLLEHIGDIIACEPVIPWVKRQYPDAFVVWIVKPQYVELLSAHPDLDAVVTIESLLSIAPIVRSRVFDVALDLHVNRKPTEIPSDVHTKTWGDPSITAGNYYQHGTLLHALTRSAGVSVPPAAPRMHIPRETIDSIDRLSLPPRFVVIHRTSNVVEKDWSTSEWRTLVTHIIGTSGMHVLEVGLDAAPLLEHPKFMSLCGRLSLLETAEVIRRAAFFIGVDSAPAHMANAWRRPAMVLFSGAWLGDWSPYDGFFADEGSAEILRPPGLLREVPASRVIAALEASMIWREASRPSRDVASS